MVFGWLCVIYVDLLFVCIGCGFVLMLCVDELKLILFDVFDCCCESFVIVVDGGECVGCMILIGLFDDFEIVFGCVLIDVVV